MAKETEREEIKEDTHELEDEEKDELEDEENEDVDEETWNHLLRNREKKKLSVVLLWQSYDLETSVQMNELYIRREDHRSWPVDERRLTSMVF